MALSNYLSHYTINGQSKYSYEGILKSLLEDDIRKFGYNRDGKRDCRQIVIGIMIPRDGIPLCHHVFPGNTVDKSTVVSVIRDLKSRFRLDRVVFVGDRGIPSDDNLEAILDEGLGFIVAHTLRRNAVAAEVIEELGGRFDRTREEEQFLSDERTTLRFVLAYSPEIARTARAERTTRMSLADAFIENALRRLSNPVPARPKAHPTGDIRPNPGLPAGSSSDVPLPNRDRGRSRDGPSEREDPFLLIIFMLRCARNQGHGG